LMRGIASIEIGSITIGPRRTLHSRYPKTSPAAWHVKNPRSFSNHRPTVPLAQRERERVRENHSNENVMRFMGRERRSNKIFYQSLFSAKAGMRAVSL
jgi:hypothetical protein